MMIFQGFRKYNTVCEGYRIIIFGMNKKGGWRLVRNLEFIGIFNDFFRRRIGSKQVMGRTQMPDRVCKTDHRINEDHKIRTQADLVRIGDIILYKMSSCRGCQMAPRRKTHDTNPFWIDTPLRCPGSYELDRPLCILQWTDLFVHHGTVVGDPVFQNKCGDTGFIKPLGDFSSFIAKSQDGITAARTNNYGRSGRFSPGWQKDG